MPSFLRVRLLLVILPALSPARSAAALLTGPAAMGDWSQDAPGLRRRITVADLPPPQAAPSATNHPSIIARPHGVLPRAPAGFTVSEFAAGLRTPRVLAVAPNGDVFVTESEADRLRVLRDADDDGKADSEEVFARNLHKPFGIAFYPSGPRPRFIYVANADSVMRYRYRPGDLHAEGEPQTIVTDLPGGGHWTRNIAFSRDDHTLFVSIGSESNDDDTPAEQRRARILAFDPDGANGRVFACGISNPVGLAIDPETGALWTSVSERDGLGDDLPPDFITRVREDGFYGWPWFYIGGHQDPRHPGGHPGLADQVTVPDVLIQAHSASLNLAFYSARSFPARYRHNLFACEHGSWNRTGRTGYKVIMIPVENGVATGEYEDFLTGFVTARGQVWGRPAGIAVAHDGALLVSDDASGTIWRVSRR